MTVYVFGGNDIEERHGDVPRLVTRGTAVELFADPDASEPIEYVYTPDGDYIPSLEVDKNSKLPYFVTYNEDQKALYARVSGGEVTPIFGFAADSGPPPVGIPSAGTTGQLLAKVSDDDFDTTWTDPPSDTGPSNWSQIPTSQVYSGSLYRTEGDLYVRLRGDMNGKSATAVEAGEVLATMPQGVRPDFQFRVLVPIETDAGISMTMLTIKTSGQISVSDPVDIRTTIYLDSVIYPRDIP